jgi:hypothetical protein
MAKKSSIQVKDVEIKTLSLNNLDYLSITDIAKQKNPVEPKDVVKNWMRLKVQELLSKEGKLWASLTDEQRQEVLLSYEESEDEKTLINSEKVFGRF